MKTTTENKLLNLVSDLIVADENRTDTGDLARSIRIIFVDELGRKDPLGMMDHRFIHDRDQEDPPGRRITDSTNDKES